MNILFMFLGVQKKDRSSPFQCNIRDNYPLLIVICLIILYVIIFSYFSFLKHDTFQTGFDLAIFEQSCWTTIHEGSLLANSFEGGSHFLHHNSPILFLLLPFYFLFQQPYTLLVVQTVVLGLAALPLFFIARKELSDIPAVIIVAAYLMYPALHGVNLYDYHEVSFVPVLIFSAFYYQIQKNYKFYFLFVILSLLIKEDVSLLVFMLGLYGMYKNRGTGKENQYPHIIVCSLAIVWFLITVFIIFPSISGNVSGDIGSIFVFQRYSGMEGYLTDYTSNRITHFLLLFIPLLFIPFIAPEALVMGLPNFLEIFLAPYPQMYSIEYHYSALIIPPIFLATVYGLKRIRDTFSPKILKVVLIFLLLASIISMALVSPSPIRVDYFSESWDSQYSEHHKILDTVTAQINPETSVATQANILPHLSKRSPKMLYQGYSENADLIISDKTYWYVEVFSDYKEKMKDWKVIFYKDGIAVFENPAKNSTFTDNP